MLVVAAGRSAPTRLGEQLSTAKAARAEPFTAKDIRQFLKEELPGIDHAAAPLHELLQVTGGIPYLLRLLTELIRSEVDDTGAWGWRNWPTLLPTFTGDPQQGLVVYAAKRLVRGIAADQVWRIALVRELTLDVARILFPDGDCRELLPQWQKAGLLHQGRQRQRQCWIAYDLTRDSLAAYAQAKGLSDAVANADLHRALADHYDRLAGWTPDMAERFDRSEDGRRAAQAAFAGGQWGHLVDASYHRCLELLATNRALAAHAGRFGEFAKGFANDWRGNPAQRRAQAGNIATLGETGFTGRLTAYSKLSEHFAEYDPEDTLLFDTILMNRALTPQQAASLPSLIDKYRPRPKTLALIATGKFVPEDHRHAAYRAIIEQAPTAAYLGDYALFLKSIRGDMDGAEEHYRRALAVDGKHANTLANLAGLLLARGEAGEGREMWRRAMECAATHPQPDILALELWFYAYAHLPEQREEALRRVVELLERGVRSKGFDLSATVARARRDGHPRAELVAALAEVIADARPLADLAAVPACPPHLPPLCPSHQPAGAVEGQDFHRGGGAGHVLRHRSRPVRHHLAQRQGSRTLQHLRRGLQPGDGLGRAARLCQQAGQKGRVHPRTGGVQVERAGRQLDQLGEAAGQGQALHRVAAQVFQQAAGKVPHVDMRRVGQAEQPSRRRLRGVAGAGHHMAQPQRPRHVDAAMDGLHPRRAGIGHHHPGGAQHRQAADDAQPAVEGPFGQRAAAGNG